MRYASDYRSASRENHKAFCDKYKSEISFENFKKVIYTYNSKIMTHVLETGDIIPLPWGFGKISVNRKKTISTFIDKTGKSHIILPVDWVKTKEQGKKVHFYNDHSDGFRFRWMWFKDSSTNLKMKDIWAFKPAREWSKQLKNYVSDPEKKYLYNYSEFISGRKGGKKKKNNGS